MRKVLLFFHWLPLPILLLLLPLSVFGETGTIPVQIDAIDVWLDGYMEAQLEAYWIPGAAVAIVTDKRTIIRGFGFQDPISRIPVDPKQTMFRIASITKTFTWAAVMELVQEGTLDLDRDISAWVDDDIFPATGRSEITLRNLITHTAGFEENSIQTEATQIDSALSNRDHVTSSRPQIVYHPGEFPAYSNYGAALAGFVIEAATGTSWEEWILDNIVVPADMTAGITTEQSSSVVGTGALSSGWSVENGGWVEKEHYGFNGPAAGAMSATAEAMAKWLRVFLGGGVLQDHRVLREDTVEQMMKPRSGYHPELGPIYYGFIRRDNYGLQILGHDGVFGNHISDFLIYPELGVGVFVVYNKYEPDALQEFIDGFTRYIKAYPTPAIGMRPAWGIRASHSEVNEEERQERNIEKHDHQIGLNGYYLPTRNNYSTIEKVMHLNDAANVKLHTDGILEIEWLDGGGTELTPIGESVWHLPDEELFVAATKTASGETVLFFQDPSGTSAMRKLSVLDYPPLHIAGFVVTYLAFSFAVIWIPFAPLFGCRNCEKPRRKARRLIRSIIWLLSAAAVPGTALIFWFVLLGEGYLFGDPVVPRVLTFSNCLVFIVLGILVAATVLMRRFHPLGRKSIPFMTRSMVALGLVYTFLALWWNLVPWQMV